MEETFSYAKVTQRRLHREVKVLEKQGFEAVAHAKNDNIGHLHCMVKMSYFLKVLSPKWCTGETFCLATNHTSTPLFQKTPFFPIAQRSLRSPDSN